MVLARRPARGSCTARVPTTRPVLVVTPPCRAGLSSLRDPEVGHQRLVVRRGRDCSGLMSRWTMPAAVGVVERVGHLGRDGRSDHRRAGSCGSRSSRALRSVSPSTRGMTVVAAVPSAVPRNRGGAGCPGCCRLAQSSGSRRRNRAGPSTEAYLCFRTLKATARSSVVSQPRNTKAIPDRGRSPPRSDNEGRRRAAAAPAARRSPRSRGGLPRPQACWSGAWSLPAAACRPGLDSVAKRSAVVLRSVLRGSVEGRHLMDLRLIS